MGLFNTVNAQIHCPHCNSEIMAIIDIRFGFRDQFHYDLGDKIIWEGSALSVPKQRPDNGNYCGEGYVICPVCDNDFNVIVNVKNDVFDSVVVESRQ